MKLAESIRPISYVKTHASEIISNLGKEQKTIVITQNGEAKAVLQDVRSYEETQDTLALLKIIAHSKKSIESGNFKPAQKAFSDVKKALQSGDQ